MRIEDTFLWCRFICRIGLPRRKKKIAHHFPLKTQINRKRPMQPRRGIDEQNSTEGKKQYTAFRSWSPDTLDSFDPQQFFELGFQFPLTKHIIRFFLLWTMNSFCEFLIKYVCRFHLQSLPRNWLACIYVWRGRKILMGNQKKIENMLKAWNEKKKLKQLNAFPLAYAGNIVWLSDKRIKHAPLFKFSFC